MAYNTKTLLGAAGAANYPVAQIFEVTLDDFKVLTGQALGGDRHAMDTFVWGKTAGGVYLPHAVDASGNQLVSMNTPLEKTLDSIASYQAGHGTGFNNQKTVTTAGTAVQLGAQVCNKITIKALPTNTGLIYVGFSSGVSSTTGFILSAKEEKILEITDASMVWINSSVNGEGVSYIGTYQPLA